MYCLIICLLNPFFIDRFMGLVKKWLGLAAQASPRRQFEPQQGSKQRKFVREGRILAVLRHTWRVFVGDPSLAKIPRKNKEKPMKK